MACKSEHEVPIGVNRTWVKYIEHGEFPESQRSFSVMRCNHCADAPCVEVCPVDCIPKDPEHEETQEELLAKKESLVNGG